MQTLTINIQNDTLTEKVLWLLEHFKKDGLEITSKENIEDLKLLKTTRSEETISFEDYSIDKSELKNSFGSYKVRDEYFGLQKEIYK